MEFGRFWGLGARLQGLGIGFKGLGLWGVQGLQDMRNCA